MKKFQLTYKKNNVEKYHVIEAENYKVAWGLAVKWAISKTYDVRFLTIEEI